MGQIFSRIKFFSPSSSIPTRPIPINSSPSLLVRSFSHAINADSKDIGMEPSRRSQTEKLLKNVATETDVDLSISYETLRQTSQLCGDYDWDNVAITQNKQDEILAQRILNASAATVSKELKESPVFRAYTGNPMDMRAYIESDSKEIRILKLEDNTFGWGGLLEAPKSQLIDISKKLRDIGGELARIRNPVILVACSGRSKINSNTGRAAGNSIMGEKIWVADQIAQGLKGKGKEPDIIGFEPDQFKEKLKETNYQHNGKATIFVGYSEQFNDAKLNEEDHDNLLSVENGQVRFAGRDVHCLINERFACYVQTKHGKIDPNKTWVGPMIDLGTNKALAYAAHNKFIAKAHIKAMAPNASRKIKFITCKNKEEVIAAVEEFNKQGIGSVCKPKGTGGGHGIIITRPAEYDKKVFDRKLDKSVKEVDQIYNKQGKVAGMPYTVSEYLEGATIHVPEDLKVSYGHLEGFQFEIRMGICTRNNTDGDLQFVAVPNTIKLQLPGSDVANVTTQKALSGLRNDELILPALNADVMRLTGVDEAKMTELAKFAAAYQLDALIDLHNNLQA